jgi:hypothetical protein
MGRSWPRPSRGRGPIWCGCTPSYVARASRWNSSISSTWRPMRTATGTPRSAGTTGAGWRSSGRRCARFTRPGRRPLSTTRGSGRRWWTRRPATSCPSNSSSPSSAPPTTPTPRPPSRNAASTSSRAIRGPSSTLAGSPRWSCRINCAPAWSIRAGMSHGSSGRMPSGRGTTGRRSSRRGRRSPATSVRLHTARLSVGVTRAADTGADRGSACPAVASAAAQSAARRESCLCRRCAPRGRGPRVQSV